MPKASDDDLILPSDYEAGIAPLLRQRARMQDPESWIAAPARGDTLRRTAKIALQQAIVAGSFDPIVQWLKNPGQVPLRVIPGGGDRIRDNY